mmetsp:Transcript_2592/g.5163  ORF Transcript_2592/g.5163 Transcript_2592/m.5163 type:complete len:742 (-) Transcript_2592:368-2593(-)|eukprot:CAMPEP_0114275396 /NCGR_PEP_ID=MMETSP0058-20121206/30309_1 /TAXON_ID=36894 /ORGANISM="Pyramimonas parkeae, CCMP726" /LENGTH=741 /DNA_ID=CAMNT_0001395317 /DNA_START=627 /DNA_END=2852 /DNA_ORIENTATION=-
MAAYGRRARQSEPAYVVTRQARGLNPSPSFVVDKRHHHQDGDDSITSRLRRKQLGGHPQGAAHRAPDSYGRSSLDSDLHKLRRPHASFRERSVLMAGETPDHGVGAGGGMQMKLMKEEERARQSRATERELSDKVGSLLMRGHVQRKAQELLATHSEVAGDVMDEFGHQLQEKNKPFAIPSLHRSILEKSPSERTATDIKLLKKKLAPLIEGNTFLSSLPQGLRTQLLYYMRFLAVPPAEVMYLQNQPGYHFFVVVVGEVRLTQQTQFELDSYPVRRIDPRSSLTVRGRVRHGAGLFINFNDTESHQAKADGNPLRFSDFEETSETPAVRDSMDDFMLGNTQRLAANDVNLALEKVTRDFALPAEGRPIVRRAAQHDGGLHLKRQIHANHAESTVRVPWAGGPGRHGIAKTKPFMGEELRDKALRMERLEYSRYGNPQMLGVVGGSKAFDQFGQQVLECVRMPLIRDHTATTVRPCLMLYISRSDFDQASYEFNVCTYGKKRTAMPAMKGLQSYRQETELDGLAKIAQWDIYQKDTVLVLDDDPEHLHYIVRGQFQLCNLRPDLRTRQVYKELHANGFGKKYQEGKHYEILLTGSEGDFFGTDAVFGGMAILGCVLKCHSLLEVMKFKSDSFLQNIKGSKAEGALFMEMAKRIKAVQAATIWGVNKIRFPGGLSADAYMEKLTSDGIFVPNSEDEGNHMLKRFGSVVNDIRDVLRGRKGNNRQNVMDLLSEVSRGQQSLKS